MIHDAVFFLICKMSFRSQTPNSTWGLNILCSSYHLPFNNYLHYFCNYMYFNVYSMQTQGLHMQRGWVICHRVINHWLKPSGRTHTSFIHSVTLFCFSLTEWPWSDRRRETAAGEERGRILKTLSWLSHTEDVIQETHTWIITLY